MRERPKAVLVFVSAIRPEKNEVELSHGEGLHAMFYDGEQVLGGALIESAEVL